MASRLTLPLFALALFLSAALLFNVQPMVGKLLLPRVGGSPEVWNVAMAFFQVTLLAGYVLTHALSRLSPFRHGLVYVAVLAVAAPLLPIGLPDAWRPSGVPQLAILGVLVRSVALPFLALSLGAPTLQRLFAASSHGAARDPYFLYAASNAGSFGGLLLYPLVFEPLFALPQQTALWTIAYSLFFAVAIAAVAQSRGATGSSDPTAGPADALPIPWALRLRWVLLAAVPSSLTLGVTTHIATDIAATPLLWAATLGLYLLTFIVAFAHTGEGVRNGALAAHPWIAPLAVALTVAPVLGTWTGIAFQLLAFTLTALACHSALAAARPSAAHLTAFYLWVSVGGALGGSFNAFVAPVVFDAPLEYPLALLASVALRPLLPSRAARWVALAALVVTATLVSAMALGVAANTAFVWSVASFVFAILVLASPRPAVLVPTGTALVAGLFALVHHGDIFVDRNFFGMVRIRDIPLEDGRMLREILHGTTVHGAQLRDPPIPVPIGYYSEYSPVAALFRTYAPDGVAIVGLASGGMNCFARPGQQFRFYEIDPLMETVARDAFTFLADCPPPRVEIGDGRLLLEAEPAQSFDLIVIDAFAADSIPVHLITTEAIAMYMERLTADGVLAFNISNRYFDLIPVLQANARALGLALASAATIPPPAAREVAFTSQWAAMTRAPVRLAPLFAEPGWRIPPPTDTRAWTDAYSNPIAALKTTTGYPGAVTLVD